jgi:hypothetical protein
MDSICDLFESPIEPRPRSPAARADKLAFFNEVGAEALKTYTPVQLTTILNQRGHVSMIRFFKPLRLTLVRSLKSPKYNPN